MGITRDSTSCEIDIIKEMAEGLGSSGFKLEDLIEKSMTARQEALEAVKQYGHAPRIAQVGRRG